MADPLVSINSLRHSFGRQPFATGDQSRNLQADPGSRAISGLERCHLAWDVVRISPERQQTERRAAGAPAC